MLLRNTNVYGESTVLNITTEDKDSCISQDIQTEDDSSSSRNVLIWNNQLWTSIFSRNMENME